MIKLDVADYCHGCNYFNPISDIHYPDGNIAVCCENKYRCMAIARCIEGELKNKKGE